MKKGHCLTLFQIKKDVPRTSSVFESCQIPMDSGKNPLYNILAAYAELDPEVGYTQGMNFLVALIYQAVGNETLAFTLLQKVMYDLKWRDCYRDDLIKLISITRKLKQWLMKEHKTIAVHLDFCGVILEA